MRFPLNQAVEQNKGNFALAHAALVAADQQGIRGDDELPDGRLILRLA